MTTNPHTPRSRCCGAETDKWTCMSIGADKPYLTYICHKCRKTCDLQPEPGVITEKQFVEMTNEITSQFPPATNWPLPASDGELREIEQLLSGWISNPGIVAHALDLIRAERERYALDVIPRDWIGESPQSEWDKGFQACKEAIRDRIRGGKDE